MNKYLVSVISVLLVAVCVEAQKPQVYRTETDGLSLSVPVSKGSLTVGRISRMPVFVENKSEDLLKIHVDPVERGNIYMALHYIHNGTKRMEQRRKISGMAADAFYASPEDILVLKPGQEKKLFSLSIKPVLEGRSILEVCLENFTDEKRVRVVKEIPNSRVATTEVKRVPIENVWKGTLQLKIPVKVSPGSANDHDINASVLMDDKKGDGGKGKDHAKNQIAQLRTLQQLARQRNGIGARWFAKYIKRKDINSTLKNHAYCELLSLALDGVGFKYLPQLIEEAKNPNTPLHVRLLLVEGMAEIGSMATLEEMGHIGKNYIYMGSPEPTRGKIKKIEKDE
jgi:hypothetical protein